MASTIISSPPASSFRQTGNHILFVEGGGIDGFDPTIIAEFFHNQRLWKLRVAPLGPSFHVRAAAEALHPQHPTYYFIIDRDHHDDEFVERHWKDFPNPLRCNLLVWRRKELESYFIDPDYLAKSNYCRTTRDELSARLEKEAQQRIWLEIANHVIVTIREESKETWITTFDKIGKFTSRDSALNMLLARPEFAKKKQSLTQMFKIKEIQSRFEEAQSIFLDGDSLKSGRGQWMKRMSAKEMLRALTTGNFFEVREHQGKRLAGIEKTNAIVKDLLRLPLSDQPSDFQALYKLLVDVVT